MLLSAGCAVGGSAEGVQPLSVMKKDRNWSGRLGVDSAGSRGRLGVASCLRMGSESVDLLVGTWGFQMSHGGLGGVGTRGDRVQVVVLLSFFRNREVVRFRWWVNRQRCLLSDCEFFVMR